MATQTKALEAPLKISSKHLAVSPVTDIVSTGICTNHTPHC